MPVNAVWHVLPINDAMEHREGMDCPCRPRLERAGVNHGVIVHNAFDGRVDVPELNKVLDAARDDDDAEQPAGDTCLDCDHPMEYHNAAGCGIEQCGCMTEGDRDD